MRVSFLRLNRNVWLATFIGMTEGQVSTVLSVMDDALSNVDHTSYHVFNASSINSPGYIVVQLDRQGAPIPPFIKDIIRTAVNDINLGNLT